MLLRRHIQDPRTAAGLGGLCLAAGVASSRLGRFLLGEGGSSFGSGIMTGLSIGFLCLSIILNVRAAAGVRAAKCRSAEGK